MSVSRSGRIRRGLAALVLILSTMAVATTSVAAESKNGRPFRISVTSEFLNQAEECAPGVPLGILTGAGRATHMGALTITGETCGLVGVANWIAANGDTISTQFDTLVTGPPNPDGSIPIAFEALSVSGTGRFVDVEFSDEFVLAGLAWFYEDGSGGYLEASGTGLIFYDASNRSNR